MDSYKQLEFDKIKKLLANNCHSVSGKLESLAVKPLSGIEHIRKRQRLIREIQKLIKIGIDYEFHDIADLLSLFDGYEHLTYSFSEFLSIYKTVTKASEIHRDYSSDETIFSDCPEYQSIINQLVLLPQLSQRHEEIFADDGEVVDTASPLLKKIRQRQSRIRHNILDLLQQKMQEKSLENVIQDKIITLRDDRYVLPIKEGTIGSLPGIIHGYSGSKATIFVEPNEAIGLNNEIHQLRQEEKEEIFRILKEFTLQIQEQGSVILQTSSLLNKLDFSFAIARFGNSYEGKIPFVTEKTVIQLREARHPLLLHAYKDRKKVIPFDLVLGEEFDLLVLSGPNTGGKTVTLKAIGLITLMALSGLPVPVAEDSEIGLFTNILADIGDQQSLEDSLSTFSAHLRHIQEMLNIGDEKTLVLIDEIGAATDPEQGAALAQAILEDLIKRRLTGVVTTHYTPLKLFALGMERCQNAAMLFDPERHIPTYRFKTGLPGNSFALEIAEKLGLQNDILNRARELTGRQNVELTDLLTKISTEKKELAQTKFQYDLKLKLLEMKVGEYENKLLESEADRKSIRRETMKEARDYLSNIQRELTNEIASLRERERLERKKAAQRTLRKVTEINHSLAQEEKQLFTEELTPVDNPQVGDVVWIKDIGDTGKIVALEKNGIRVDFNGIFLLTDTHNLFRQKRVRIDEEKRSTISKNITTTGGVKTELKLIGLTFDEALPKIETFIDEGYAAGLSKLRIVHGKGTGALRDKIRGYLKSSNRATEFYSPAPEAGGEGVTVIVLN